MKKAFNITKLLVLTIVIFFIGNNTVFQSNSKTINDNLDKKMSINVITEKQKAITYEKKKKERQKAIQKLYQPISTFVGTLTGYSADCPGCSGNLACTGTSVKNNGIYYNDKTYGKIRIVATSASYPCGTIIRFNHSSVSSKPVIAIALDRGVSGNKVDLLAESSSYALNYIGSSYNKKFEILRLGW